MCDKKSMKKYARWLLLRKVNFLLRNVVHNSFSSLKSHSSIFRWNDSDYQMTTVKCPRGTSTFINRMVPIPIIIIQ